MNDSLVMIIIVVCSKISVLSLFGNRDLDWDLELLGAWPRLENVLMQRCSIHGTLPIMTTTMNLKSLILERNRISGKSQHGLVLAPPAISEH